MNRIVLTGNLTRDPEKRSTAQGTAVTSFTIAVRRKFKDADGNYPTDFFNCVAWRSTAEYIAQYFQKGSKIGVIGSMQTRKYQGRDGREATAYEVNVEEAEMLGGYEKKSESKPEDRSGEKKTELDDFEDVTLDESDLPF